MAKYDYDLKKLVVEAYQQGKGGYGTLARQYGIPADSTVHKWVKIVEKLGFDALHRRKNNQTYSFQFKQDVIHYYLTSGDSYLAVALKYGLSSGALLQHWHQLFLHEGIEGLLPKMKGRPSMTKKKQTPKKWATREQELERENELLRAELAFIKKLRALGMTIPDRLKSETHESSTNSEKEFRLTILLEATKFPKATYMYWQKRLNRENPEEKLEETIKKIFEENNGNYGYRRIQIALNQLGLKVNQKKIRRIMRKLGLKGLKFTRKSRKYSSYKGTVGRVAKNLIHRRFVTTVPHQKITTDTSEFKYYEQGENGNPVIRKLYLDAFLDLFNGEILSYRMAEKPTATDILDAQKEAIERTADCPYRRTFHSDQGWAYQMNSYRKPLADKKIFQSMSRKGNCLDNSPMENFFGLLKQEMYYGVVYTNFEGLKQAINKWIYYYNHQRIKTKLRCSPVQYRERITA
ncbi:IS3 family transposase [Enterococcus rivorum]|uniref:IS3 family transposase n=1 Tax=Enterococcus rivorum TaxID=762845 RepID=UPI00360D85D4